MQILFSTLRQPEKSTRNPRAIPVPCGKRGLRDLFCIFSQLYATFSYLFIIISIGIAWVCLWFPLFLYFSFHSYSFRSCRCAWNRAEKLAQNVDVEMKFNLTFLLTQFCVSSESGFWPKHRMYHSYKWIYRLACAYTCCTQTDAHNCRRAGSRRTGSQLEINSISASVMTNWLN